jgi:outer membrane receptor for ferrienterochelin and colicins
MKKIGILLLLLNFKLSAQTDSSVFDTTIDEIVCFESPCPTAPKNVIHPFNIITRETILKRAALNVEELMMNEANIRFRVDPLIGSAIQIGGMGGENVRIMIDGVQVIGRLNGNVDLSQIPTYNIERIEVVQGSLSNLYGSNASGGAINIVTRKSQINKVEARFLSNLETNNIQNHSVNLGYRFKKVLFQTGGNYFKFSGLPSDTTRSVLWNPKEQWASNNTIRWNINNDQTLTASYNFFKERIDNLGDIKLKNHPNLTYALDDYYHTKRNDININYQGLWKKFTLQSTLAINRFDRLKEAFRYRFANNENQVLETQQDTSQFTALLSRTVGVYQFNETLNIQAGLETYNETAVGNRIVDRTQENIHSSIIGDYAFFALARIQLLKAKNLCIQPSFRASYNTKYNAPITPAIHFLYQMNKRWAFRASYANGFRAPSLKELYFNFVDINHNIVGNTDLRAEKSDNFILGPTFTRETERHSYKFSLYLFYNNVREKIVLTQIDFKTLLYTYMNIGQYNTQGFNSTLTYQYRKNFNMNLGFVCTGFFNDMRNIHPDEPRYIYSPELNADISYTFDKIGLTINTVYRIVGKAPIFNFDVISEAINENILPSYQMMNCSIIKSLWKNKATISCGAKNIFNIQTLTLQGGGGAGHGTTGNVQPINLGRNYFVSLGITI